MGRIVALLKKVPFVRVLARNAREAYYRYRFRGLLFDCWRYFKNRESRTLYRHARARMAPSLLEQKIIRELKENGISIVQLSDLLPEYTISRLQQWAETLLRAPEIEERIRVIESGIRPPARSNWDKFYLVRPLGDSPVFDIRDSVLAMVLSEPILRIVCGYLGMFSRLAYMNLWYNVATKGPDEFSQRWHRDPEDRSIVKTFLYLRDVDETHGPFSYVPGTHGANAFTQRIGVPNYPADGVVEKRFSSKRRQVCTGKAGTLIFCDTTGFHKGGHPTAGARFLFNAVYLPNSSEPIAKKYNFYSVKGARSDLQNPAARYAISHLVDSGKR
jgi:hypothetical protein